MPGCTLTIFVDGRFRSATHGVKRAAVASPLPGALPTVLRAAGSLLPGSPALAERFVAVSRLRPDCHVLIDFDGTIVPGDATDSIFDAFADTSWQTIEADLKAGRIGAPACLSAQVGLLRTDPAALDALIATFDIDPGVPAFLELCRGRGVAASVVSDGLDRAVEGVLARHELNLPFRANHLVYAGSKRWRVEFPHQRNACVSGAGNCKCATAMSTPAMTIMVGDGRSDFCVSNRSTFVLAKGALAAHCEANGLPHARFETFQEATALLTRWFDLNGVRARVRPRASMQLHRRAGVAQ